MAKRKWLLGASGAVLMAGMAASSAHANLTFDLRLTDAAGNVLATPKSVTTGAGDVYFNLYAQVASANDATRAFQSAIGSFVTGGTAGNTGSISGNGETVFTFFGSNPVQTSATKYPSAAGFLGGGSQQGASASIAPTGIGAGPDGINDLGSVNTANIDNYVVIRASQPNFTGTAIAGGEEWLIGKVKMTVTGSPTGSNTVNWLPRLNASNAITEETALWYEDAQAGNASGARTGTTGVLGAGAPVTVNFGAVGPNQWNVNTNGAWEATANWSAGVLPDGGAANFLGVITAPRTVTLTGNHSVTGLNFDNANKYTLVGPGTVTVGAGGINVVSGSHAINTGVNFSASAAIGGAGSLTVGKLTGTGTLTINNAVTVATNGGNSGTSAVDNLAFGAAGKLDLNDNDLVVRGGSFAAVQAKIVQGFNGGDWLGNGITSSVAANDLNGVRAIGYASNADLGLGDFSGVTLSTGNEILVKHTWYGDSDLNGVVNGDDFNQFLFGLTPGTPAIWLNGDFDYNGVVNGDDFSQFLVGLGGQSGPLAAAEFERQFAPVVAQAIAAAAVPEPTSASLLLLGVAGLVARRRRK